MNRLLLIALLAACQTSTADTAGSKIFDSETVFEMEMHFDFGDICMNPKKRDCEDVPGWIVYEDAARNQKRVDINIRTRGRWDPGTARCEFPSLFVFFDQDQAHGTVFEGQTMLPLTTHCQHLYRNYRDYVQIEYLTHRIYEMLTEISLRSRLLSVHYKDTDSRLHRTRYAFFVEHFNELADRTATRLIELDDLDLTRVRPQEMTRLSVFQFMIGNLDWSALKSHNVALFEDEKGMISPVPFDFDYSGIVYTPYAKAPSEVPVYSVLHRYYRGLCWPGLDWNAVLEQFEEIRPRVFVELENLPDVSGKQRRRVKHFLLDFYKILASEKDLEKDLTGACRNIPAYMLQPAQPDS